MCVCLELGFKLLFSVMPQVLTIFRLLRLTNQWISSAVSSLHILTNDTLNSVVEKTTFLGKFNNLKTFFFENKYSYISRKIVVTNNDGLDIEHLGEV